MHRMENLQQTNTTRLPILSWNYYRLRVIRQFIINIKI